jgi:hypothetical protein
MDPRSCPQAIFRDIISVAVLLLAPAGYALKFVKWGMVGMTTASCMSHLSESLDLYSALDTGKRPFQFITSLFLQILHSYYPDVGFLALHIIEYTKRVTQPESVSALRPPGRPPRFPSFVMPELIPYPETLDLRRLTNEVHRHRPETGKVDFTGTVKVHGTNITVVFWNDGSPPQIQSRNRVITPESAVTDNHGAAAFLTPWLGSLRKEVERALGKQYATWKEMIVAGEFAGHGIQKGVGVSELERFYIIFGLRLDGLWMPPSVWKGIGAEAGRIFNVFDFQTFKVTIDFTPRPRIDSHSTVREGIVDQDYAYIEKMEKLALWQRGGDGEAKEGDADEWSEFRVSGDIERMTQAVEDECPIALKMGGVRHGVGEGIVWVEESLVPLENPLKFKSKGPKHRVVGKRMPQKQGPSHSGKRDSVERFVTYAVTDVRLRQGLESLTDERDGKPVVLPLLDKQNIPRLCKWVMADVVKEEGDVMQEMGLTQGEVGKDVMGRVREFFEKEV